MVAAYMKSLREDGWEIAGDWTASEGGDWSQTKEQRTALSTSIAHDVLRSDVFWMIAPSYVGGSGTWSELGLAAACATKPCVVSGGTALRTIFTHMRHVQFCATHDDAFGFLRSIARAVAEDPEHAPPVTPPRFSLNGYPSWASQANYLRENS